MLRINDFVYFSFKRFYRSIHNKKCFNDIPIYENDIKIKLENYWKNKLEILKRDECLSEKKYILSMFPYPSGNLHMGHMRVYTVADTITRYHNLCGKCSIFPMGWDSFGLPAENAAFERGLAPEEWTLKNIADMKKQLQDQMTLSIDWDREISTSDPKYFKWTQWIFARLFEKGFAYQRSDIVNWDPVDRTVLADELIDKEGRSWRSGSIVEKKPLKQWFLRTTALTESLLEGLKTIKGEQWRHVVDMQQGWLGELEGVYVEFDLVDLHDNGKCVEKLAVFTTRPVAVLTDIIAFVEINENNVWWKNSRACKEKNYQYLSYHGRLAVKHPLCGRIIPLIINPDLKFNEEECLTARFGIPFLDLHDARTAYKLNILQSSVHLGSYNVIKGSAWRLSEGHTLNENLEETLKEQALKTLQEMEIGGYPCSRLRTDWLISRQRYWGTPIPIIHCPDCGPVIVPNDDLPVTLPDFQHCQKSKSQKDTSSPLANAGNWVNVSCPKCGHTNSKRETDTMDTFVDSSWYYLRYLDPQNENELCSVDLAHINMPVDIYIGGIEHAIRHLYYARFIAHFLYYYTDIKWQNGPEPFSQFLPVGLVLGQTYETKLGQFVPQDKVKYADDKSKPIHIDTGEELINYWDKMSKSKNNGVTPESVVKKYGLDTTRLVLLTNTGPDKNRKWQENDVVTGIINWEKRMWKMIKSEVDIKSKENQLFLEEDTLLKDIQFIREYRYITSMILHGYRLNSFSSVIAFMQKLTSHLLKLSSTDKYHQSILYYRALFDFLVLLHPLSPLLSSELWAQLSSVLHDKEGFFADSNEKYLPICGKWSYDLNKPIWEQSLLSLIEKDLVQNDDKQSKIMKLIEAINSL